MPTPRHLFSRIMDHFRHHEPQPSVRRETQTDDRIRWIEERLKGHPTLDLSGILISIDGDQVILRGRVHSLAEGEDLEKAAAAAPGITAVENKLILQEIEYH